MIKITNLQIKMLSDRASLTCCLVDVLSEQFNKNEIEKSAEKIEAIILGGVFCSNSQALSKCDLAVLADCVDGSTYFASAETELTKNEFNSRMRSAWNLENKIESEFGINCVFPLE